MYQRSQHRCLQKTTCHRSPARKALFHHYLSSMHKVVMLPNDQVIMDTIHFNLLDHPNMRHFIKCLPMVHVDNIHCPLSSPKNTPSSLKLWVFFDVFMWQFWNYMVNIFFLLYSSSSNLTCYPEENIQMSSLENNSICCSSPLPFRNKSNTVETFLVLF